MKKFKIIGWVSLVLFFIFAVILIFQLIVKLSGNSPTDIQILYVSIGAVISYLLLMSYQMGTFVGEVREFMKTAKNSFAKLREDIKK